MFLDGTDGAPVAITPDVFHDVMELAPVDGWQVMQESTTGLTVSIVGPQAGYDASAIMEDVRSRLREQGANTPVVQIRVVEKLQHALTGKTPLVQAWKHS